MKTTVAMSALALAGLFVGGCGSSSSSSSGSTTGAATAAAASCPHNPIRFAVEPYDGAAALEKAYATLATALQTNLGCPVKLIISDSYVAEIEAMRGDQIELGEFGPLGYVLAHRMANAQSIAAFGDANGKPVTYTAGIWVPKNSSITTVAGLKGHTLALSSTTSTSGGLFPIYALLTNGLQASDVKIRYTGGHPADVLALTHGTADAAEVNSQEQSEATASGIFKASDYREIWKSDPIENDPITVRGDLPAAFKARVTAAILQLTPAQVSAVDTELGTGSVGPMVPAPDSLYAGIAALADKENASLKTLG